MERDEIIKGLYQIKNWKCNGDAEMYEVIASAIRLLEQPDATSDAISRQAAVDEEIRCVICRNQTKTDRGCDGNCRVDENLHKEIIRIFEKHLLPAQGDRAEGHWIWVAGELMCSECHTIFTDLYPDYDNSVACPHCGADMKGETE